MGLAAASLAYSSTQHHTSAHLAFPQREKSNADFNGFYTLMQALSALLKCRSLTSYE